MNFRYSKKRDDITFAKIHHHSLQRISIQTNQDIVAVTVSISQGTSNIYQSSYFLETHNCYNNYIHIDVLIKINITGS